MSLKIYLAGPLFTSGERRWNDWLASALTRDGFLVILPQAEAARHISSAGVDYAGIFTTCLEGVRSANIVLAMFDGVDVDSGTAFECGYAYSKGIPIVGVRTDLRSGGEECGVNAMLSKCCQQMVHVAAFESEAVLSATILGALSAVKALLTK
jgi:nucleoside 2-deoxyribosyltransferase